MDSTWDCLQLILLESWTNWIYLRLHSVDVILGLNYLDFTWDCIQFRLLSIYLMLLSKKLFFCLSHLGMNQIEKYRQNLEVTLVIFIQHSYQISPNLLCTLDALLMHFWCTFKKFMNFWQMFQIFFLTIFSWLSLSLHPLCVAWGCFQLTLQKTASTVSIDLCVCPSKVLFINFKKA